MNREEIDNLLEDEITCPHCGTKELDSWEILPDCEELGRFQCDECGGWYSATRNIVITYSTYKIDWLKEWKRMNNIKISYNELRGVYDEPQRN